MLTIDIIESKTFRIDPKTGGSSLDLVSPSWGTNNITYGIKNIAFVSDETEMRPDLVSLLYMGQQGAIGTLLKINGISNPLSIASGEVLVVPSDVMKRDLFDNGKKYTNQRQKAKSFRKELQEKISKVSQERLEYLNAKNISNIAAEPLPPNILGEGEQQIEISDGKLIFGPDIGQCRTKSTKNVSVVDLKAKLAQKNIFRR